MKNIILPIALLALLTIGAITIISRKELSNNLVTVDDWMNCYATDLASCEDVIDSSSDYNQCKSMERDLELNTNPVKCPSFWSFINRAKGTEYINQDNLYSNCYFTNEKEYSQGSYYFYTQIFYPRYHTCSGL